MSRVCLRGDQDTYSTVLFCWSMSLLPLRLRGKQGPGKGIDCVKGAFRAI